MTDKERMEELVSFFCDADARGRREAAELRAHEPTLGEALDALMGEA